VAGLRWRNAGDRNRGGHDLRSWFITTAQEHGAHRDLLLVITHTSKSDVMGRVHGSVVARALC